MSLGASNGRKRQTGGGTRPCGMEDQKIENLHYRQAEGGADFFDGVVIGASVQ